MELFRGRREEPGNEATLISAVVIHTSGHTQLTPERLDYYLCGLTFYHSCLSSSRTSVIMCKFQYCLSVQVCSTAGRC